MKIHFGSGGNFLHFYLGIAAKLQSSKQIITHLSGVSAGTFAASFLAYNIDIDKNYHEWNYKLCKNLTQTEKIIDSFFYVTKPFFENKICMSELDIWSSKIIFNKMMITSHKFCGKDDIFHKIICSCYVPIFSPNKSLFYKYEDNYYIDGVLTFDSHINYDLVINYKDYIQRKTIMIFDKLPSSDVEKNIKLFELGKESVNLRIND